MKKAGTSSQPEDAPVDVRVARVYELLVAAYGAPEWRPHGDALGELVATVLSQHTSDVNSARAYAQLLATFPTWEQVRDADPALVEKAIRSGGLAGIKTRRIQEILREVTRRQDSGSLTLQMLATLPTDEAEAYLRSLPGVGLKTVACVLLFSLGTPAFPVDTHVARVTKRLGWISASANSDAAHEQLKRLIPPEWRHTLHINLITLGRRVCYARQPACRRCPIAAECPYYWHAVAGQTGPNVPARVTPGGVSR